MKRLVFTGVEQFHFDEVADLKIEGEKEVLIDITHAGICGTDLHIYSGRRKVNYPLVAGHEAIGIVKAIGSKVTKVKVGDRVAMEPNTMCRTCALCMSGHNNLCHSKILKGLNVDGVFQTQTKANEEYFWVLPDNITPQEGIVIETATVALAAVNKAGIRLGDYVFITGAGTVGLLVTQLAKLSGAIVTVMDLNPKRLELAQKLGADYICGSDNLLPKDVNIAIDCAGVAPTINTCISVVKNAGTFISVGIAGKPIEIDMMNITRRELNVKGSVACTTEFPTVIQLISEGKLDASTMVSATVPFENLVDGIKMMESQEAIKVAVSL